MDIRSQLSLLPSAPFHHSVTSTSQISSPSPNVETTASSTRTQNLSKQLLDKMDGKISITNKLIQTFIQSLEKNSNLYNFLSQSAWETHEKQHSQHTFLAWKQTKYPIYFLSLVDLQVQAERYSEKYDISIKVCEGGGKDLIQQIRKEWSNPTPRYVGLIYHKPDRGHVVPIILRRGRKELSALVLDIIGEKYDPTLSAVFTALEALQIHYRYCIDHRQVDGYSCRIGALITLRNALLDLNSQKAIHPLFSKPISDACPQKFNIPPQWGFTDQLFRPKKPIGEILNPRQCHSRKEGKIVETIAQSRARYQRNLEFEFELTLPDLGNKSTITLQPSDAPDGVTLEFYQSGQINLHSKTTMKVNAYMLEKAHKLAGLNTPKTNIPDTIAEKPLYHFINERFSGQITPKNMHVRNLIHRVQTKCLELCDFLSQECWKTHRPNLTYIQNTQRIPLPTLAGLQAQVEHYKNKYDISINVVEGTENLEKKLKEELQDTTQRYLGLIYCEKDSIKSTPLILKIDGKMTSALILDPLDANVKDSAASQILTTLNDLEIPCAECNDVRQTDHYFSRIAALVILRNALLDLKSQTAASGLFSPARYGRIFDLPLQWGFTDQIFDPDVSCKNIPNPRQLYSKIKGKKIEMIGKSRARHRLKLDYDLKLVTPEISIQNCKELSAELRNKTVLTYEILDAILPQKVGGIRITSLSNGETEIKWKATIEIPSYLHYKARKIAGLSTEGMKMAVLPSTLSR